jgi:hypothetical protein
MVGESSYHGVVVIGAGGAPARSLLGEGRHEPPPSLEAIWNSSMESPIMDCHGDNGPLRVEPMKAVPESFLLGETLKPLK